MNEQETTTYDRLLEKSKEAFVLALEIYNRPSIKYRVEGFSFFICNAWELMLKAHIINTWGMNEIYYKDNPERTITLERCIARVYSNKKDPLRCNLEDIIRLRNKSTHFIVEEYEQIYVGLFQSCVNNFDEKMFDYHRCRLSDIVPPHFLTLSMTASPATPETIRAKYPPEIAERFLFDEAEIEQEAVIQDNRRYSTVLRTEVAIVKNPKNADFTVAYDAGSDKRMRTAKVFQDPRNTHPLSVRKLIEHVNKRLNKEGIILMASGEQKSFTSNDWRLFMRFYDLKHKPEYGYSHAISQSESYTYSMKTVDFIMEQIKANPGSVIDDLKALVKEKTR